MRQIAVALMIACLSAPLLAADADQAALESKKEKRVCRESTPTGSRLPKRICRPKSEWEEIDRVTQEDADREVSRVQAIGRSEGTGFSAH